MSEIDAAFDQHRPLLWKLCYRMTGCAADADDLVQETYLRSLERPPADRARDLKPWLVHVALNLSRDQLRKRKRQAYVGPWLPSPIETSDYENTAHPEARYSELESVSMAFLIALEALSPGQRAVLLLRDVLGYSVEQAAEALSMTAANVKTTHHRARAALAAYDAARMPPDRALQRRTLDALNRFMVLLLLGDVEALEELIAADAVALNDGAGQYNAARVPITGVDRIITFHRNVQRPFPYFAVREINGLPAVVAHFTVPQRGAADDAVFMVRLDPSGRIAHLHTIVAPRKLTHMRFSFGV